MDESEMDEGVTSIEEHRAATGAKSTPPPPGRNRSPDKRRTIARDPGSQIRRLKCFKEVDALVREGKYLREIVKFIQIGQGELTDMSRRGVTYLVKNYRDSLYSDDEGVGAGERGDTGDTDDPFYVLHSMERHYQLLEKRIDMETKTEEGLTKLFSTTHKEFLTLQRLGEAILKQKEKLGLLRTERGGMRQRVGSGMPGKLDTDVIFSNPESRHKVAGLVEAMVGDPDLLDDLGESKQKRQQTSRPKRRNRNQK